MAEEPTAGTFMACKKVVLYHSTEKKNNIDPISQNKFTQTVAKSELSTDPTTT